MRYYHIHETRTWFYDKKKKIREQPKLLEIKNMTKFLMERLEDKAKEISKKKFYLRERKNKRGGGK